MQRWLGLYKVNTQVKCFLHSLQFVYDYNLIHVRMLTLVSSAEMSVIVQV